MLEWSILGVQLSHKCLCLLVHVHMSFGFLILKCACNCIVCVKCIHNIYSHALNSTI